MELLGWMGWCLITTKMTTSKVGQQRSVGIANRYRLYDPQIEPGGGDFRTPPDQPSVPHSLH